MKKLITTGIILATISIGGVAIADTNPYTNKTNHFEIRNEKGTAGYEKAMFHKTEAKMTLGKWNDEVQMSVAYKKVNGAGKRKLLTNKIEWQGVNEKVVAYPVTDGYEFEVVLASKPDSNVFEFEITGAEDLDFRYQRELTQTEVDGGKSQPENVFGSYAVYHKTKANYCTNCGTVNYETGKAFHIYRPKVIDDNDDWVWGILDYSNGVLTVTAPQAFLDNAVYPVIVDPTFGYTTIGANNDTLASATGDSCQQKGVNRDLGEDGTMDLMSIALVMSTGSVDIDVSAVIYREDSAGTDSHDKVLLIERLGVTINTTPTFQDFTGSSQELVADTYVLSAIGNAEDIPTGNLRTRFDTGAPANRYYSETTAGAGCYATRKAEDPWTEVDAADAIDYSFYVTYTVAGGPEPQGNQLKADGGGYVIDGGKIMIR